MRLSLDLPDELAAALTASTPDLPRAALEAIALQAFRERKISTSQLRRLLGFSSRYELDGFLKLHQVWLDYSWDDLELDRDTHRRLGL
jgi:hypothetical protein